MLHPSKLLVLIKELNRVSIIRKIKYLVGLRICYVELQVISSLSNVRGQSYTSNVDSRSAIQVILFWYESLFITNSSYESVLNQQNFH